MRIAWPRVRSKQLRLKILLLNVKLHIMVSNVSLNNLKQLHMLLQLLLRLEQIPLQALNFLIRLGLDLLPNLVNLFLNSSALASRNLNHHLLVLNLLVLLLLHLLNNLVALLHAFV